MTMTMEHLGNILNKKKWQPKLDSLEGLPIRPSVKQTRLYLDNEYYKKGYGALFPHSVATVYNILAMHANHEKQYCFPAAKTIMELGGITNRNTVFEAFKILETYNIISIVHRSKGRVPNVYVLLDTPYWKTTNSINFETVMQSVRKKQTVSKKQGQQLQNQPPNSDTDETGIHISNSDKEIKQKIPSENTLLNGKRLIERLSPATKYVVTLCFRKDDIIGALEELGASGSDIGMLGSKPIVEVLRRRGAVQVKEHPSLVRRNLPL